MEDSDEEILGVIRPNLIQDIRKVLAEYPDDGQILKEMIQNAEDAGAAKLKIVADMREFHHDIPPETVAQRPYLSFFKGPALCVYNDEVFSDNDWKGIRMLHLSVKEKDPLKVGRFGLGFKSVFHLTDRVVILSGDYILYMDPFKNENSYCTRKRLSKLSGPELEAILHCVEASVFGISRETFRRSFRGTLFWFPLRQAPSELSRTLYSVQKVVELLEAFKGEINSMLLFLNNIHRIAVYCRKTQQTFEDLLSVSLSVPCLENVTRERKAYIRGIPKEDGVLPDRALYSELTLTVQTKDNLHEETQNWRVVHYYPGKGELTAEQSTLCTDPELSYRPSVGVAFPIPMPQDQSFQSQVFCTMPLPVDTRSITGLPVHVNGFFALSQNRRHLKWPDQLRQRAHLESSVRWNLLLVEHLLPRAYVRLLEG
ncbi:hypothetical protein BaRGS_00038557, partial [Batillaria attramentaria]